LQIIKDFESLRLAAYLDTAAGRVPTIGWGHTRGVQMGMTCTPEQADAWLAEDVQGAEACVMNAVQVPLSSAEFAALVSLVFNIGCGAFSKSTLLRLLNAGDRAGAAGQFKRWVYDNGVRLRGLVRRRDVEAALFAGGTLPVPAPVEERVLPQFEDTGKETGMAVPIWLATLGWEALRAVPDLIKVAARSA
jgi:lysozyme